MATAALVARKMLAVVKSAWAARWVKSALAVATLVCAVGWYFGLRPVATTWGPVSSWLAAVGTLAAVYVSIRLARDAQRRTDALEDETRRQRLRSEARRLSWYASRVRFKGTPPRGVRPFKDEGHQLAYGYSSGDDELDGHTAYVVLTISNTGEGALSHGALLSDYAGRRIIKLIGVIPPGEMSVAVPVTHGYTPYSMATLKASLGDNPGAAWVEFRDGDGNYWRRLSDGALEQRQARLEGWRRGPSGDWVEDDRKTGR